MILKDWINQNRLSVIDSADSWEEAIWIAAKPLLRDKAINNSYVEKIIEAIKEEGPYVVIAPNIALPHVRYPEGVKETSTAFLKINKPVYFFQEEEKLPVQIMIILATVGNDEHIYLLQDIVSVLEKEEMVEAILSAKSIEDFNKLAFADYKEERKVVKEYEFY